MSTVAFQEKKKEGRWFEALMEAEIYKMAESKGYQVRIIDTDKQSYTQKRGNDRLLILIKPDGSRHPCNFEFKLDLKSQDYGNAYLDLDSIATSDSPIWAIGFPVGEKIKVSYKGHSFWVGKVIKVYTMYHQDLAVYAQNCPYKVFGGEFWGESRNPPKDVFLGQNFVRHWKTINLN